MYEILTRLDIITCTENVKKKFLICNIHKVQLPFMVIEKNNKYIKVVAIFNINTHLI